MNYSFESESERTRRLEKERWDSLAAENYELMKNLKKYVTDIKHNIFEDAVFGDQYITKSGRTAIYLDQWDMDVLGYPYKRVNIVVSPEKPEYRTESFFYFANGVPESHNMCGITDKDKMDGLTIIRKKHE